MKILIYSDCFIFGGSENVIENILKSDILTKQCTFIFYYAFNKRYKASVDEKFAGFKNIHSISILSAFSNWGYENQLKENKSRIRQLYVKGRYLTSRIFQQLGSHNSYNYSRLLEVFKKEKPDILYINNGGYPGAQSCRIAVLSAKKAGIKNIIFNVNNLALPQHGAADKKLDEKINTAVKIFVTASKAAKQKLIEQRKFDSSKCIDIPNTVLKEKELNASFINGILKKEFNINNELVFGAAGLLTERKGFDVLIDAIHILQKSNHVFKVFIFGEGEQRINLEKKIKDYDLEQIVFLPGYRNNLPQYIKDFDLLVCPSIANEDFPYTILEAMLLSKPIVGTNIAGIPEQVIDQYNGFVVPAGNATSLAEAINQLLMDKENIKIMGENSYKRYNENFNNELVMQRYKELFESLN